MISNVRKKQQHSKNLNSFIHPKSEKNMFLKTEEQCRKLKCTDVMKNALIKLKVSFNDSQKMENSSSNPIHAFMADVMDECFQLYKMLANETSASETTLYIRENKGLRMTKNLQSAIYF
jgi:hypothetical protein